LNDLQNGVAVTDEQLFAFVDREVTPRFPDCLTILTGFGQESVLRADAFSVISF
jgi:hypothetical protein